jgi:hypothetical protein
VGRGLVWGGQLVLEELGLEELVLEELVLEELGLESEDAGSLVLLWPTGRCNPVPRHLTCCLAHSTYSFQLFQVYFVTQNLYNISCIQRVLNIGIHNSSHTLLFRDGRIYHFHPDFNPVDIHIIVGYVQQLWLDMLLQLL